MQLFINQLHLFAEPSVMSLMKSMSASTAPSLPLSSLLSDLSLGTRFPPQSTFIPVPTSVSLWPNRFSKVISNSPLNLIILGPF